MPEQTIWRGASSQWKNFGRYFFTVLLCAAIVAIFAVLWGGNSPQVSNSSPYILLILIVPILIALTRYLQTKNKIYELTTERLKTTEGVFSKVTDTLELYRVKDLETRQPFLYRLVGIENVQVNTSDTSSPFILIQAIPSRVGLADKIRNQVEAIRAQKGVREIDVE
jgi:membrane protein YdbS with pleckstrin-like domain